MASLRADLQSEDSLRQAAALLQLLNAMAGGRDVGTPVTIACQTVIKAPVQPAVKRLGYSIVKGAALSDSDWENVLLGFLSDISPTAPSIEVQCAALEILPLIPPHKLKLLMSAEGRLTSPLGRQLAASIKEVRAAALSAVGRWLSDTSRSAVLAGSPGIKLHAQKWIELIVDALLDHAAAVSGAAFDASRRILSNTEEEKLEPGGCLRQLMAQQIAQSMLETLPSLLQRCQSLQPQGQVEAAAALVALVEFCCRQPVFPTAFPAPVAGLPDSAGNLMSMLEDSKRQPSAAPQPGSTGTVIVDQVGSALQGFLGSIHAPLVNEAALGLLRICDLVRRHQQKLRLPAASAWAPLAIAALVQLWDKEGGPNSSFLHAPIAAAVSSSIRLLPARGQLQLVKEVLPMIAEVPSAAIRTACLGHVWGAVVDLDLATRHNGRSGEKGQPANELRSSLTEPFVVSLLGSTEQNSEEADNSALREELVCTLVESLLSHPQGVIQGLKAPEKDTEDPASLLATMKAASRVQSAGLLVDWLGAAKIALQGSKACLGWDRDPAGATYACTAVTDSWLTLLQRCLQAARALQAAPRKQGEAQAILNASRVAASYVGAFQELLDQLLMHWQALSGAVQPRALWVAAHHYELAPSMDPGWAHLLQALATSLGAHDDDARTRRKQALKAAAAAGQMQPLMLEGSGGFTSPIDEAEIQTEAMAVGLIAADRLASLLLHNAAVGPRPGLKDISSALVAILQPLASPNSLVGPQSREHAARIAAYLAPLALGPAPSAEAGEAVAVQTEFGAKLIPAPDWPLDEGFPMAGPSGKTLQTTRRGSRYWALRSQVQEAVATASERGIKPEQDPQPPSEAVGFMDLVSLISETGEMGPATVLTAPNDPLRVTAWHILDHQTSRATLQFEAFNQFNIKLDGVTIKLGLGGPMIPEAKQPPAYKLASLPAQESVTWRFSVRLTGFGRISVQPFVTLPISIVPVPGDTLAMRCEQYHIPLTELLARPSPVPSPQVFFPAWQALASGMELTGVCRNKGAVGGLQALTALESGRLARVYFKALPAQGGFQSAHASEVLGGAKLGIITTAQLLPIGRSPSIEHSGEVVATGHVVCRMSVCSTSADVVESIAADPQTWLQEVFGRTLIEGTNADGLLGPAVTFRLDPSLIPVERLYTAPPENKAAEAQEEDPSKAVNGAEEHLTVRRDPREIAEEAVQSEWHRLRQQRMGLAP